MPPVSGASARALVEGSCMVRGRLWQVGKCRRMSRQAHSIHNPAPESQPARRIPLRCAAVPGAGPQTYLPVSPPSTTSSVPVT